MEIKIPKEVRDYHENIFFGLNTRQFICSVLAVGVAVGIYFALQPYVGTEEIGWILHISKPKTNAGIRTFPMLDTVKDAFEMLKEEQEESGQCDVEKSTV